MAFRDQPSIPYQAPIDGLRALAVCLVLFDHWAPWREVHDVLEFGRAGLILFFILSGYLITSILLALRAKLAAGTMTRGAAFRSFYLRRVLRIVPIYLLAVTLAAVLFVAVRADLGYYLLFLQNLSATAYPDALQPIYRESMHLWSLAVEEQFYLAWAPAVLLLRGRRQLTALCIAAIAAALTFKAVYAFADLSMWGVRLNTLGNIDSLAVGCLLALHWKAAPARWDGRTGALAGVGASCLALLVWHTLSYGYPAARETMPYRVLFDTLMQLALVAAFILGVGRLAGTSVLTHRWVIWIGKRSYGIYVWHEFVRYFLQYQTFYGVTLLPKYSWQSAVVFFAAVLVASELSWRLIEGPILQRKARLSPAVPARA